MTKKIKIEVPDGKCAEWVNNVLTLVDEKPKDITGRIKTFDDAWKELGGAKHPLCREYEKARLAGIADDNTELKAYLQLRIICAALNEGWQPQFTTDEYRYYSWFYLLTQEKYDNLSEEEKGRVVGRASGSANASGGLVCANAGGVSSSSHAHNGSRLVFKTRELAEYAGHQFLDIWADFVFKVREANTKD